MTTHPIILCPGQGAQRVGMGRAWLEHSPEAAQTYGAADEVLDGALGDKLSRLCFEGPSDTLDRTDIAQPAIFVTAVACFQAMFARHTPGTLGACAGLSLGEYSALHLAGCMSFEDALRLVVLRGRAMQDAAEATDSSMVALIGADEQQARDLCDRAAEGDVLVPANFNAPGQIVLSGAADACARAVEMSSGVGLRAKALAVAGAFHSPLMAPAADRLAEALARVDLSPPSCPVLSNVTGVPHGTGPDVGRPIEETIRQRLVEQLTAPVRWVDCCRWLIENGPAAYHELAPGKVLSGLMKKIDRSVKVEAHDEP